MKTALKTVTSVKPSHNRYGMVSFYVASRKMAVSKSTNEQCVERLNTILDDLTANYGVVMNDRVINGLTGHVLQSWFNNFMDGRKPSTINNYVSFLNPFLRWAFNIGYMPDDVSRILKTVKIPSIETLPEWERPKDRYLSHEEVSTLLNAGFTGKFANRDRAIVALFLYSGIRVSELCSLTLGSVFNCDEGYIYCKRKGGNWSYVEVSSDFYNYLSEYLAERNDLEDLNAPLFRSYRGGHLDRRGVYAAIAPVQKELGLATGPHALRHTYISEVDKIGGPAIARDLANHSSLRITNRYDHSSPDQRREVLNKLSWNEPLKIAE